MEYNIQETNYPSVYLLYQTKGLDSIAFSTSMWASYPNNHGWNMGQTLSFFDQMEETKGRSKDLDGPHQLSGNFSSIIRLESVYFSSSESRSCCSGPSRM
jgi:hypothetical protein